MGICLAIAAGITAAATLGTDIGFSVEEKKKQDELNSDIQSAQDAMNDANNFYQTVFKIVKTNLEHLKQSLLKLPPDAVQKLQQELQVNIPDPNVVVTTLGYVFGGASGVFGLTDVVSCALTGAGLAAVDGLIATIGTVAGAAGIVFAVAGFGLTLYTGIKDIEKLNDAIDSVKKKKAKAEDLMTKMKNALDDLISKFRMTVSYDELVHISDDWSKLAANFDKYTTSFYTAMIGFQKDKTQEEVIEHLQEKGYPRLNDDVLVLAKLIEEHIVSMMKDGKTNEDIIDFYLYKHPREGLHFQLSDYVLSKLRSRLE